MKIEIFDKWANDNGWSYNKGLSRWSHNKDTATYFTTDELLKLYNLSSVKDKAQHLFTTYRFLLSESLLGEYKDKIAISCGIQNIIEIKKALSSDDITNIYWNQVRDELKKLK